MANESTKHIATWASGAYALWAVLTFVLTLGGAGHAWWPILVYLPTWPFGILLRLADEAISDVIPRHPVMMDVAGGLVFLIGGTIWVWLLTYLVARAIVRCYRWVAAA